MLEGTAEEKGDGDNIPVIPVEVRAPEIPDPSNISRAGFLPGGFGWPGIPFDIEPFIEARLFGSREIPGVEIHLPQSPSVQHSAPSSVPPQNPSPPVSAAALATPPSRLGPVAGVFSLWQQMLITAFNDPIGDHDNRLGPGDIATADLRYRPTDFDNRNRVIRAYGGSRYAPTYEAVQ